MLHRHRSIAQVVCLACTVLLLAACGGGGGGSTANDTDTTTTTIYNVNYFTATSGDGMVSLSWQNASESSGGTLVRRGSTCPATPTSGTQVVDTQGNSAIDAGLTNGTAYCYTAFAHDGNGHYATGVTAQARPAAPTGATYTAVSAGGIHTLGIKSNGTLWAWGFNDRGTLGDGCNFYQNCYDHRTPMQVGTDTTWRAVSAGTEHSVALKQDGTIWSWGDNSSGEIGSGQDSSTFYISTPTQSGTDNDWIAIAAGGFFTAALKSDGTLWAWGDNYAGILGDGCIKGSTCTDSAIPRQIGTDGDWAAVAAGSAHVLALKTNGTLWVWGDNYYNQLGLGEQITNDYSSVPVQVGTDTDWQSITAGDMHSLAIKTDGTLWAWGNNNYSQLGLGSAGIVEVPTQVGTDTNWQEVDGGFAITLARKTNGTIWAWGHLSSTTGTTVSVPTQVGTATTWTQVSAGGGGGYSGIGGGHFMALQSTGPNTKQLMGWGTTTYGQIGIGTVNPVWSPTLVR